LSRVAEDCFWKHWVNARVRWR